MTLKTLLKRGNNKILILGKGYIGNFLHQNLKEDTVIVGSNDLDYHNQKIIYKFLINNGIETVINCSGFTGRPNVDQGELEKEKCWHYNVTSPLSINKICNTLMIRYIHISSGCIYDGYDSEYTETDNPNFGLYNHSSFYSKSKHAFEILSREMNNYILRIRMPVTPDNNPRNYLVKILNYDNIINKVNSKTYIPDLSNFIDSLLNTPPTYDFNQKIYNVVNPNPLGTSYIVDIMDQFGIRNPNWKIVDLKDLDIVAPRSNCVLNGDKANGIYQMRDEEDIIREAIKHVNG
jgi:UDP-glucose 4,6-dehydratase